MKKNEAKCNKKKLLEILMTVSESVGVVFYFYGDNVNSVTDKYGEALGYNVDCRRRVGVSSTITLGISVLLFFVIPQIYKKYSDIMNLKFCCHKKCCSRSRNYSPLDQDDSPNQENPSNQEKQDDSPNLNHSSTHYQPPPSKSSQAKSSKEEHSGWSKALEMFVIVVTLDSLYSTIDKASNEDQGTFCGPNNRSVTIFFFVVILIIGVLLLSFHARLCCKDFKNNISKIAISVALFFMVGSLVFLMLEDNRQPLVCGYKHNETNILSVEYKKFITARIGVSVAALATGSIATTILLIGKLCSTYLELLLILLILTF